MLSNQTNNTFAFQKAFQTLTKYATNSNTTLTQRINAQQVQINSLQNQVNSSSSLGGNAVTKTSLGLDQVTNTSDANKEVSLKTQAELDKKHDLISDATDKRLPQTHVEGLTTSLNGKHPLLTDAPNKRLSQSLVEGLTTALSEKQPLLSDATDKRLSQTLVEGLTTALSEKQPLLSDAPNKRLPQSHVEGLTKALSEKQPLIQTSSKLSKGVIDQYYFADIQTESGNTTTLSTTLSNINSSIGTPTISINTSSLSASSLTFAIGSIIQVNTPDFNMATGNNTSNTELLASLPKGTWYGCIQIDLIKGANFTWGASSTPCRVGATFTGTTSSTDDFYPITRPNQQTHFINNNAQGALYYNIPVLFRCKEGRSGKLVAQISCPVSLISGANANQSNSTQRVTLHLTKIGP